MIKVRVAERDAGQRLDKYLRKYLAKAPSSFVYKMLRKKNITLNEKKASGNEMLRAEDEIAMFLSDDTILKFGGAIPGGEKYNGTGQESRRFQQYKEAYEAYGELGIVYEHDHVLIVNKPVGMLTQKAAPSDRSLNEWLIGYLMAKGEADEHTLHTFKPSVCNRLDRNTSGLVLCGKTLAGSQKMSALLKDRSLRKFYSLYVKGVVTQEARIEGSLKKDENTNKVELCRDASDGEAVDVLTVYKPIKNYRNITLLEVELITGKTHQIRVHLASVGHPVIGDYKYGYFEWNDRYKKKYGITTQLLHAIRLEFPQMEGEWADISELVLTAEPPEIFRILDEGEG